MNSKKRLITFGIAVLIAAGVLLYKFPHVGYLLKEYFGCGTEKAALTQVLPENTVQVPLSELKTDDRVRFDQSMMLINTRYPLSGTFLPRMATYKDTQLQINAAAVYAYTELANAVKAQTKSDLLITSAYRTWQEQEAEYQADAAVATKPGASEHQAGLALDICVRYYGGMGFVKTKAGQFVNSNCWRYGFIIRYPVFGKQETGIGYEPWHIRYVGLPHANIIYNNRLTLEEYIDSLEYGVWYQADGYLIARQKLSPDNTLCIVDGEADIVISPDNMGGYVVTVKLA